LGLGLDLGLCPWSLVTMYHHCLWLRRRFSAYYGG